MKKVILYVIAALLIIALLVMTFFPGMVYAVRDSSGSKDKCKPGPGYDEESWKEHMSHHPNIYKECLENA